MPIGKRQPLASSVIAHTVFVVVILVMCLTVNLATRVFRLSDQHSVSANVSAKQALRQCLELDAIQWSPPVPAVTLLERVSFYPRVAPAGPPIASALFEQSLYNRPPPSC
jgi:hypothetical protein